MNLLSFLYARRDWVALVLALLFSFGLMNTSEHPSSIRYRQSLSSVLTIAAAPFMLIPKLISVWGENAELRAKVVSLEGERESWRESTLENIRLRLLLGMPRRTGSRFVSSNVLLRDADPNFSGLIINRGTTSGVKTGHAVVTIDGLAGIVYSASVSKSVIQLATDRNFAASVRDERSRVDGILRWNGADRLIVTDVPKNQDIKPGDRIITSGLGGLIPAGIPVGVVTTAQQVPGDLFLTITIDPAVAFTRIEEVFVQIPLFLDGEGSK